MMKLVIRNQLRHVQNRWPLDLGTLETSGQGI
jgi:hypothetical protein